MNNMDHRDLVWLKAAADAYGPFLANPLVREAHKLVSDKKTLAQVAAEYATKAADTFVAHLEAELKARRAADPQVVKEAMRLESIKGGRFQHPDTPGVTWVFYAYYENSAEVLLCPENVEYKERRADTSDKGTITSIHTSKGERVEPRRGVNMFWLGSSNLDGFTDLTDTRPSAFEARVQHDNEARAEAKADVKLPPPACSEAT